MRNWLTRNAEPLEAVGAIATAFAALTALVVIPYQVAQADRIQRDQTAREIYREFLSLTVQKPELANADYCAMKDPKEQTAYAAYVEYLLYTSEQMIDTSPDSHGLSVQRRGLGRAVARYQGPGGRTGVDL